MSEKVIVPQQDIEVLFECDVFVLGLGMSGFSAAISAARAGASVVACEMDHFPGGIATTTLMCSISNYFVTRGNDQVTFGLPIELLDRVVADDGAQPKYLRNTQPQIPFDPETMKRVMIEMLCEDKVKTLYESTLIDVVMDSGKVSHVILHSRDRIYAVKAKQFVDASGELAIFHRAGGEIEERDDGSTLCYRVDNVNIDAIIDWFEKNPESYDAQEDIPTSLEDTIKNWREFGVFHLPHGGGERIDIVAKALENGELSDEFGKHCKFRKCFGLFSCTANKGAVIINSNWYYGDCYDIETESERENEARLHIKSQVEFLRKFFPGFQNAYLRESGTKIGHRWPRRAVCNKMYMKNDFMDGVPSEDCIGYVTEVDRRTRPFGLMKSAGQLPLSMIISDKTPNVIVGSAKNPYTEVFGAIRGQAGCLVMGRGAGVAAAVAALQNKNVTDIDVKDVQLELKKQGMYSRST